MLDHTQNGDATLADATNNKQEGNQLSFEKAVAVEAKKQTYKRHHIKPMSEGQKHQLIVQHLRNNPNIDIHQDVLAKVGDSSLATVRDAVRRMIDNGAPLSRTKKYGSGTTYRYTLPVVEVPAVVPVVVPEVVSEEPVGDIGPGFLLEVVHLSSFGSVLAEGQDGKFYKILEVA